MFHTARLACLTLRSPSWIIDVNCQNWPITGYTSSLYTREKYWKQCWQAHLSVSPQSSRSFRATLFDPLFPYHLGALKWDSAAKNANKSTWLKLRKRASEKLQSVWFWLARNLEASVTLGAQATCLNSASKQDVCLRRRLGRLNLLISWLIRFLLSYER